MTYDTINDAVTMQGGEGTLLAGRYRIIRQLGTGGMGSVWLAEDTQLDNKPFAIKMLPSILVSNKRAYRQLKDEALVAMRLVHPNIVQIRAFEENNGNPFLVMDYVEGQTLDDYLAEKGKLTEDETVRILKPIAAALDYAHGEGVVHRDVKPANIMIRKDGHPYILDFGIAREIQETMTRVTGKLSSGTLLYMSPEQLNGDAPKPAQDIYSFAAMAYECLKGEPPFSRGQIEFQILNNTPPPLVGRGDPTAPLIAGVMAGLAKKPEARPPTCAAVLAGEGFSRVSTCAEVTVDKEHAERVGRVGRGVPAAPHGMAASIRSQNRNMAGVSIPVICIIAALLVVGGVLWHRGQQRKPDEWRRIVAAQKAEDAARQRAEDERKAQEEAARKKAEVERLAKEIAKAEAERKAKENARLLDEAQKARERELARQREEAHNVAEKERLAKAGVEAERQAKENAETAEHLSMQREKTELLATQKDENEKRGVSLPDRKSSKYWEARLDVANNYFCRGQKSECMKIYDEFFKVFPKPPADMCKFHMEASYAYGQILVRYKQYAKAIQRYEALLAQLREGDDQWCNIGCETVELYQRLAGRSADQKQRDDYLKSAGKIVDKLLLQLSKPMYFGRAVSMKARIEQMKGDVDLATEIIDEYKPQLQELHDQIVAFDPEGKQGLLRQSPLPECMYLQAKMRWDEAKADAKKPNRNDNRIKDLMFGPKGKNGKRVGSKGAFNIALNVFLNYGTSAWAPAAGDLSEEMRVFAEKEYHAKIKSRVTVEQIATLAAAHAAESQRAEKYDDAIRNWRIIASTYTNTSFYATSLAQLSHCHGKLGDKKLEIEYINRYLTIETVKMRRLQAQFQLAQAYKNDGLEMLERVTTTNIAHEDSEDMEKRGTAQLFRAIKTFSDVTKEIDAAFADSSTKKADVDNYKKLREEATFMVGECWSRMSRPEKNLRAYRSRAAASYEAYLAAYPEGKFAKTGYLKLGAIYMALNEQERSSDILARLMKKYPDSDEANKARQVLLRGAAAMKDLL